MRTDPLSGIFAALADPTRRAILARLAEGAASVGELAQPFALTLPTVSRHIDVLEAAGLVARERAAQRRVCSLQGDALMQAGEWIARYAAFWEGRLDALDGLLRELERREPTMLKTKGEVLRFERRFRAARPLVFAALTEPRLLRRWMCPDTFTVEEIVAEPEEGGRFLVAMRSPEGEVFRARGHYREVVPPERLVFTWTWDPGHTMAGIETLITIELGEGAGSTHFVMTHAGLRDPEERESHRNGWTGALAKLRTITEEAG